MNKKQDISLNLSLGSKLKDYVQLTKFKLSMFVVISSLFAYWILVGSQFNWTIFLLLGIGGFCCTAAANTLNQVLEKDFDKLMTRTAQRPLAAGRMKISEAVFFSGLLLLTGSVLLSLINPLTSLLCMISVVLYSFLYTPLKRYTTLAVAIGAIPGALPVLIGSVAGAGEITMIGIILFGIQFLWQFPHFWSIGWLSFEDYKRAGYKLLPIDESNNIDPKIGYHSFIYSLILIPVSIAPIWIMNANVFVMMLVALTGIVYTVKSYNFYIKQDRPTALGVMFTSFFYLPIILILYLFI